LAGRRFLTGEAAEHMAAVAAGERHPGPLQQLCDAPHELDALIGRLTATDPEQRCTAREATAELAQLLKRAPSLANGERSVRSRVAHLMQRLYPAEPARSRAEFARLVGAARDVVPELPTRSSPPAMPPPSPVPGDTDPTLLAGTRYRLGREIGRGAVGIVYEAHHLDLGRTVALKVLNAECAPGSDLGQRFRSEARAIAQLDHENLVRLHDFGTAADGRPFYAMELLEGEALDRYLVREKGMDWREAMRVGVQACRALEAAHRAGVIHRDIKPGNLFLTRNGAVKLLDFGVAKRAAEVERSDSQSSPGVMIVGTPEYMAPEQAAGGAADERSDIYALGVVLYELVTGRLPHVAPSTVALLDAKVRKVPESPRDRAPQRGLPQMVDQAIQHALESDPNKRFQSAADMREALQAALREPEVMRHRRRRIAFAALGVLTLALGGAIAAGASRPEVRDRASAMVKPVIERIRGKKPGAEAVAAAAAQVNEAAEAAMPEPATPTSAGDPDEQAADPAAVAEASKGPAPAGEASPAGEAEADEESDEQASAEPADKGEESDQADAPTAPASEAAKPADDLDEKLAEAAEVMKNGRKVKGFNEIRRLGRRHMKDPRALKAWSEAAVLMHGWGEAHRVAQRWVKVDQSIEARLHLARMQRAVGKRDAAIKTLSLLLEQNPNCEEARGMLKSYQGTAVALRR
jgi:serine/threonine-protein kinase